MPSVSATAVTVLLNELRQRRFRPLPFLAGMGLTGSSSACRSCGRERRSAPAALDAQQVQLLEGRLQLDLAEVPTLGTATSAPPVVMLFDYCCPHCRQTHAQLLALQARCSRPLLHRDAACAAQRRLQSGSRGDGAAVRRRVRLGAAGARGVARIADGSRSSTAGCLRRSNPARWKRRVRRRSDS